jgi:hypothetical protein
MKHRHAVTISVAALAVLALAAQQAPPQRGGGKRKPPQDGVVKPEMRDTIRGAMYADNWFAMYPMTIAVIAKDNADPKTGCEYGRSIGDGGFVLKFADGTMTDASWKAKCIFHGPVGGGVANPTVRTEPLPEGWFRPDFDDSRWANATEWSEERIQPKQPYFEHDFKGAKWIWTGDLDLDNTVLFRRKIEGPGGKPRWTTKPDLAPAAPAIE